MREIDMATWPRRRHFEFFSTFNHPHFNLCVPMDVTAFRQCVRDRGAVFTVALVYLIARAANAIPEFRQRIRAGKVVEHDAVSPSFTLLAADDLFGFCTLPYCGSFADFAHAATPIMARLKEHPILENEADRDDLLYMTALPWVSFTSFTHPMQQHPADSVPRFAWGKCSAEGTRIMIPLSVQGHHAVMDGIHMARFYARMEEYLQQPEAVLG